MIFRELADALEEAKNKYKHLRDSSVTRISVLLTNKEILHYKTSFCDAAKKIWDVTEVYSNIVYFCVETSRGLPIYNTTLYNVIQGEGATGDFRTIEQFTRMPDERKDLVVRLLHLQIQDRLLKDNEENAS